MENKQTAWNQLRISLENFTALMDRSDVTAKEIAEARVCVERAEMELAAFKKVA